MADTTTTNYGLVKPEVGASNDTWGNKTNGNWDALDAALKAASDIANAAMPKAGGTFTGAVNFTGALTKDGNNVWHAGNFTPANYAPLAGATFTGSVIAPIFGTTGANSEGMQLKGNNPYMSFYNAAGTTRYGYIQHGGAGASMIFANEQLASYSFTNAGTLAATGATFPNQIWAKGQVFVTPLSDPGALTSQMQFRANESSNNPGYHNDFGLWNNGVNGWRGIINTTVGGSAGTLDINPNGGLVAFGGAATIADRVTAKGGGTGECFRHSSASPYMTWYNPAETTRFGYMQHTGTGGHIAIANEQSGEIQLGVPGGTQLRVVSTGIIVAGNVNATGTINGWLNVDPRYSLYLSTTNPILQFDTNDFFIYDRSANQLTLSVGGSGVFGVGAGGNANFVGTVNAPNFSVSGGNGFYATYVGGLPVLNFAPNCFLQYSTSNQTYYLYNQGQAVMSIDASGNMKVRGNITGNTAP